MNNYKDIMDIIQHDLLDHAVAGEQWVRSDPSLECACDSYAILGLYECPVHRHSQQEQATHADHVIVIQDDDPIICWEGVIFGIYMSSYVATIIYQENVFELFL